MSVPRTPCFNCKWIHPILDMAQVHHDYVDRKPITEARYICATCLNSKEVQESLGVEVIQSFRAKSKDVDYGCEASLTLRRDYEHYLGKRNHIRPIEAIRINPTTFRQVENGEEYTYGYVIIPQRIWVNKILFKYAVKNRNIGILSSLKALVNQFEKPLSAEHPHYGVNIIQRAPLASGTQFVEVEFWITSKSKGGTVEWCAKDAETSMRFFEEYLKKYIKKTPKYTKKKNPSEAVIEIFEMSQTGQRRYVP